MLELATRARAAISAGTLLEPASDNARTRVQAMQQLGRNHPLTLTVQRELQAALLSRAQVAMRAGQFDPALTWLNAAAEYGNSADLVAARKQFQTGTDVAKERSNTSTATGEAPKATPVVAESAPDFVRAKPVAPLSAVYPERALQTGQQGYVIVEFTLNVKGQASDAKVIESNPPSVFDSSALLAVKRGRFDTTPLGASGTSRRARLRISFKK